MINRRKFFGAAAAVTTAVVVPTSARAFARTLDRPEVEVEVPDTNNLVLRLYYQGSVVHEQLVIATVKKIGDVLHYGASQDFVMDFVGSTDDCSVSLVELPAMERHVGYGGAKLPIVIRPNDTLTIQAPVEGILTIT